MAMSYSVVSDLTKYVQQIRSFAKLNWNKLDYVVDIEVFYFHPPISYTIIFSYSCFSI